MNIFGFCNKYNLPLTKARGLLKAGCLNLNLEEEEFDEELHYWLGRGQHLTVRQMIKLIERPSILLALSGRQGAKAQEQLDQVGNPIAEAAPMEIVQCIADRNLTPDAVTAIVRWLRSVLPARPVSHYWVALRLVILIPESGRKRAVTYVRYALKRCREHPEFAGWSRPQIVNGTWHSASTTYQRPGGEFDL